MTSPLLDIRNLHVRFTAKTNIWGRPTAYFHALRGISLSVAHGECVGVVGESGSGKSTLAGVVAGFVPASEGQVFYAGNALAHRRHGQKAPDIQMMFQDPQSSLDPVMRVWQIMTEGLAVRGVSRAVRRQKADELAQLVGLSDMHLDRYPQAFSGGQRQRIALARALALEPRLVILDEPTSALDVTVQARILNLLLDLRQRLGLSYLMISHDISVVRHLCHRIYVVRDGEVVEHGLTEHVMKNPKADYTRTLITTTPRVGDSLR